MERQNLHRQIKETYIDIQRDIHRPQTDRERQAEKYTDTKRKREKGERERERERENKFFSSSPGNQLVTLN